MRVSLDVVSLIVFNAVVYGSIQLKRAPNLRRAVRAECL